jgi:negative regulator of flagellin synthesis FlgM
MVDPVSFGPLRPIGQHRLDSTKQESSGKVRTAVSSEPPPVSLSKLTAAARELAEAGPPVDYAKIAQIRQAIATGAYQPDADAIASAVLRHYHGSPA